MADVIHFLFDFTVNHMAYLIRNARIVNEGKTFEGDLLIKGQRIERIDSEIAEPDYRCEQIDARGMLLLPGVIDDQVHFREPGFTHKADIYTEAKAAVAGGTTSFMEMPNVNPQTITNERLEEKYAVGGSKSIANYSFYLGATNDNQEEVLRVNKQNVCGVKVFMGSSTGNMLVDDKDVLENIFRNCDHLIATHCESEEIVKKNTQQYYDRYGEEIPFSAHPLIRSVDACYASSSEAAGLARKYNSRLHILHITTAEELDLFQNDIPLEQKTVTSEACVHHLWFDASDYERHGSGIKCNPAIKEKRHKEAILKALLENKIDVIATDHAPHTMEEKAQKYLKAPSGLPLIQHSLLMMLEFVNQGKFSLEFMVEKMCHSPARLFRVAERGYLREGYFADLVLVKDVEDNVVNKSNLLYKCGWSPFEGHSFRQKVQTTFVSGHKAYDNGSFDESQRGIRLLFNNQ